MRSALLCSSHQRTSLPTHCDAAAAGLVSRISHSALTSADSMAGHSAVLADMVASSRKIRTARSWYHGLANRSTAVWSAAAKGAEARRE